ncbi:MAG TPA: carboxypeptidase-like regulatory domain-containing protein, partial [Longimicrobiales bacterium]|nr:carboxypeptidase-like regulatory domain-containing protein [Longimicrobiales bacterium]
MGGLDGWRRLGSVLLLVTLVGPGTAGAQKRTGGPEAVVTGRVVAHDGGRPLPGVEVGIEGTSLRTTTDEDGAFELDPVPVGSRVLWARAMGYEARSDSLDVQRGILLYLTLTLATDPVEIAELTVVARSPVLSKHGFYQRQE